MRAALIGRSPTGSTTHISVIDADGMAVGMTHSNGEGCGFVVPGSGVMMNNFLGEDDINPNGFHVQAAGELMMTMMCPTIVTRPRTAEGPEVIVLGSGGSNRIRSAILQVVLNLTRGRMTPHEAVVAPRLHVEGHTLNIETRGFDRAVVDALCADYDDPVRFERHNMFFGGVHLVTLDHGTFGGAGDSRRGGEIALCQG